MNYEARLGRIQDSMKTDSLDALVITRNGGIAYATGVPLPWRTAVVVTPHDTELVTVRYDAARVGDLTWIDAVRIRGWVILTLFRMPWLRHCEITGSRVAARERGVHGRLERIGVPHPGPIVA